MKKILFLLMLSVITLGAFAQSVQINSVETEKVGKVYYDILTITIDATDSHIYGISVSVIIDGVRQGSGGFDNASSASNKVGTYVFNAGILPSEVHKERTYIVNVWADGEWIHSEPYTVTGK